MSVEQTVVSYHVFCFPFRWDCLLSGQQTTDASFDERTDLDSVEKHLFKEKKWKTLNFDENRKDYYNRYAYFYDFSRNAILNVQDNAKNLVRNYHRSDLIGGKYSFKAVKNFKDEVAYEYELEIEEVRLNMYNTGVGTLSFFLKHTNTSQSDFAHILRINDYGRRLYPQFIDTNGGIKSTDIDALLKGTKEAFLADYITISDKNSEKIFKEYFGELKENLKDGSNKAFEFIGNEFLDNILGQSFDNHEDHRIKTSRVIVRASIDDRMYVLCSYFKNDTINELCKEENYLSPEKITDNWMMYMFVDNSSNTAKSSKLRKKLLEKHTYARWEESKTLYGITRFSTVMLSTDEWFPRNILAGHMKGMYFEMAQLCLMQRATILRFSTDLNIFSDNKNGKSNTEIKQIYKKYIGFINNLYFREVTAQEQGIEMYDMMQEAMRLDREVKSLDEEISEIFTFLNLEENEAQSRRAERLSRLATVFLPITVVAGLLGMNIINEDWMKKHLESPLSFLSNFDFSNYHFSEHPFMAVLLFSIVLTIVVFVLIPIGKKLSQGWAWLKKHLYRFYKNILNS
jgi:CorA-like Mg2+ transporter protein